MQHTIGVALAITLFAASAHRRTDDRARPLRNIPSRAYVCSVLEDSPNGQASRTEVRPDPTEPPDLRDVFVSWLPSTGIDSATEQLTRLPGLARANEVWERDFPVLDGPDPEFGERGLFDVQSPSSLDMLDADEPAWRGPDPLELAHERQFG